MPDNIEDHAQNDVAMSFAPEPSMGAPAPAVPKIRKSRETGNGMPAIGVAAPRSLTPLNAEFKEREVALLWPEILERYESHGLTAHDIGMRVTRVDPPPKAELGRGFDGSAVQGNDYTSAADAIIEYVTDNYHLTTERRAATYDILFYRKTSDSMMRSGTMLKRGSLSLDSPDRIMAMRDNDNRRRDEGRVGMGAPLPQQQQQRRESLYQQHHDPYGPPYPQQQQQQQQQHVPGEMREVMSELAYLRGALNESLAASREGRQPNIQPPPYGVGFAAPPPPAQPPVDVGAIVKSAVAEAMGAMFHELRPLLQTGLGTPQHHVVPAAPPPPSLAEQRQERMQAAMARVMDGILETSVKNVTSAFERTLKQQATGLGAAQVQADHGVAEVEEPADPNADLPWSPTKLDSTWPDGSPVRYPRNKTGMGAPHLLGSLFENPFIATKLADGVNHFMEAGADALKKMATAGGPVVVRRTPSGARQAGVGQAPSTTPASEYADTTEWPTGEGES